MGRSYVGLVVDCEETESLCILMFQTSPIAVFDPETEPLKNLVQHFACVSVVVSL